MSNKVLPGIHQKIHRLARDKGLIATRYRYEWSFADAETRGLVHEYHNVPGGGMDDEEAMEFLLAYER